MHKETMALVIGSKPIGQQDMTLTLLTQQFGVLTAYVPGARHKKSRFLSSCELLSYSTFVLFDYRGRHTVDSASLERIFPAVRGDIRRLALCSYFAQIVSAAAVAELSTAAQLRLFLTCLHLLNEGKRGCLQVKPVFVLRELTLLGFMPDLTQCLLCSREEMSLVGFDPIRGDLLCGDCLTGDDRIRLDAQTLSAMRQIVYGELTDAFNAVLNTQQWAQLNWLSDVYCLNQLEQTFPALAYFQSLSQPASPVS